MKYLAFVILLMGLCITANAGLLDRMTDDGSIRQVAAPNFTDPSAAKAFSTKCRQLAAELQSSYTPTPDLQKLHHEALMAGEFLNGRIYVLKSTKVPSITKLRDWVKIPAPDDVAYVRIYPNKESLPPFVQPAFTRPQTRGVTIDGRYIAIIQSPYPQEMQDVLSHEMVHSYITLASPKPLPTWFQEGTAVYFSTGKEQKFYGREAGIPEGAMSSLPEDYKNNLFIFSYLEQKVGRPKVYEMIRKSVETGNADMRVVGFGFAANKTEAKKQIPVKSLILGGSVILITVIAAAFWLSKRKDDYY